MKKTKKITSLERLGRILYLDSAGAGLEELVIAVINFKLRETEDVELEDVQMGNLRFILIGIYSF